MKKMTRSSIVSVAKIASLIGFLSLVPLLSLAHEGGEPGEDTSYPIASIGVGNENSPENTGPSHNTPYNSIVPVYATFTDEHPDNYHFRVIAEGSTEGHTCDNLFALENQNYNKCGFAYNKSMYVGAGFTDTQIASIDTTKLGPDGAYWFVFGVVDVSGNR